MPIYEYCCKDCEQIFEEWQKNHDDISVNCPVCGGEAERIISNTTFVLKGTGWYVTDYANGRNPSAGQSGGNGNGSSADSEDGGGGDKASAKSETPPKAAKETAASGADSSAQS